MELAGGSQTAHPQPGYDGGLWKKPLQSERKSRKTEEGQLELTATQQKREKAKEGSLQDSAQSRQAEQCVSRRRVMRQGSSFHTGDRTWKADCSQQQPEGRQQQARRTSSAFSRSLLTGQQTWMSCQVLTASERGLQALARRESSGRAQTPSRQENKKNRCDKTSRKNW